MSDAEWLRGLARKGGKGAVNNIDARALGRIADRIEAVEAERAACAEVAWSHSGDTVGLKIARAIEARGKL